MNRKIFALTAVIGIGALMLSLQAAPARADDWGFSIRLGGGNARARYVRDEYGYNWDNYGYRRYNNGYGRNYYSHDDVHDSLDRQHEYDHYRLERRHENDHAKLERQHERWHQRNDGRED